MKKPEIFKPNIGNINNNKKSYCSFIDSRGEVDNFINNEDGEEPIDFINRLSKSGSYIFNKDVIIETKDKKYNTRIAGKLGNRIITLDNDSININDIIKIYEK